MGISLVELHAREKSGQGEDWGVFRWEHMPESKGMLLTGAVAKTLYKSGKRKGTPNWKLRDTSTERRIFINYAERDAWDAQWEATTGKCSRCEGKGLTVAGWSRAEGQTYRACNTCGGTGAAKVMEGAMT